MCLEFCLFAQKKLKKEQNQIRNTEENLLILKHLF